MTAIAEDYLQERIEEEERRVALLEETYADLRDGTLHWSQWNEELTCPERQAAAEEECWEALSAAKAELEALRKQAGETR